MSESRYTTTAVMALAIVVSATLIAASGCTAEPFTVVEWGTETEICDSGLFMMHGSGSDIYVYMLDRLVMSPDLGSSWVERTGFNGHVYEDGTTLYRVNVSDWPYDGDTILFSKSTDKGQTWSTPVDVLEMSNNDGAYGVFAEGDDIVAYSYDGAGSSEGAILSSASANGGVTWSPQVVVDDDVHVEDPLPNHLVHVNSKLYMAYWNYTDYIEDAEVIVIESSDMGATWGAKHVVGVGGATPVIATDGEDIYVTYVGAEGVYFTESSNGVDWSDPLLIGPMTDFTDSSLIHSLVAASGNIFAAYSDYISGDETYRVTLLHSPDSGETWTDLGDVTTTDHNCICPSMHYTPGLLHVTWVDVGTGSWSAEGVTQYRSLALDTGEEPIPEFSNMAVAVGLALVVFIAVSRITRSKRAPPE